MKKLISLILFACLVLTMTFNSLVGFSVNAEDNISNDSNVSNHFGNTLSETEMIEISLTVYDCLELQTFDYELISSFNSQNRFVLIEGIDCYLIYDREMCDYVEYSTQGNSIYNDLNENIIKIYYAPTYYYALENNLVRDLSTDELLSTTQIAQLCNAEIDLNTMWLTNQNNIELLDENASIYSSEIPAYDAVDCSYYFVNLKNNKGSNTSSSPYPNSCSYIAIGMLLSYYDSVVNDKIIPENKDVTSAKNDFSTYSAIAPNLYEQSPGIDDNFIGDLITYAVEKGYGSSGSNSISMGMTDDLLISYFRDNCQITVSTSYSNNQTNLVNYCKNAIANNNPVLIHISGGISNIGHHRVLGYEYTNTGIVVNFGYKYSHQAPENIVVNGYTIHEACYITLSNCTHSCSNNYEWTYNGCVGTVCPCGIVYCDPALGSGSGTYLSYSSKYHKHQCNTCGNYALKNHSFLYLSNSQNTHRARCITCQYTEIQVCVAEYNSQGENRCIRCNQIVH